MKKDENLVPAGEIILKRNIEIIELDDRLDMSLDPYISFAATINAIACGGTTTNTNCSGANCVSGCGGGGTKQIGIGGGGN